MLARRLMGARYVAPRDPLLATYWAGVAGMSSAPLEIVCVGDSVTEGQQASSVDARWVEQFADTMQTAYDPSHLTGKYHPVVFGVSFVDPPNPWTGVDNVRDPTYGLGRRNDPMVSTTTASITFTGTGFKLLWTQLSGGGTFKYRVDGGSYTNVSTNATPTLSGRQTTVTGLSRASHTVDIAYVSGTPNVEGIFVMDGNESSGVHVWEAGHGGYTTTDYLDVSNPHWIDCIGAIQPALVTLMMGINDYSDLNPHHNSPTAFKANLATIIANIRAQCTVTPSILLIASYQAKVPTHTYLWSDYVTAMADLVTSDGNLAYLDLVSAFGGYVDPTAGDPLLDGDLVHPNDTGYALIASMVASRLGVP